MTRADLLQSLRRLIDSAAGATWDEKLARVRHAIVDIEKEHPFDESNRGKAWSDAELRLVLTSAPTKQNCMALARTFRRGYGSVEQIYRWAAEDEISIRRSRPNDSFIKQIKRVAREVGWRAT